MKPWTPSCVYVCGVSGTPPHAPNHARYDLAFAAPWTVTISIDIYSTQGVDRWMVHISPFSMERAEKLFGGAGPAVGGGVRGDTGELTFPQPGLEAGVPGEHELVS